MKNPSSQQVQTIIENLEKVLPQATLENHLDMSESIVKDDVHFCGTTHCHAGWYAVATLSSKPKISYIHGARSMAKDLGFITWYDLEDWAGYNCKLWGNVSGSEMFEHARAFHHPTKRPNGAENLQHIINHWKEVRSRLLVLEKNNAR